MKGKEALVRAGHQALAGAGTLLNAGQSIAQVCQTMGIAEATLRLKELEKDNARLKRMVADLMQDKDMSRS